MKNAWTEKWDQRYAEEEFAYGEQPNNFLQQQLSLLKPGKILFPAEGEGRNAVFAAGLGWAVSAFDISIEGQKKALKLAEKKQVAIDYRVGELQELNYTAGQFDVIALIYAHFPANIKSLVHQTLDKYLNTGGLIIFEAFSKNHLNYLAKDEKMGGPRDIESLFSLEEIKRDFNNYEILELLETEIYLNEGPYHSGQGSVIRFVGRKKLVGAII
ncbi:bifunctional 2-polyprenyl-6-hydroxyphenol methylase/3-demethylubiquinol 3-O-methyltransferase UbiG [Mucilaginibacter sp. NFR10]|uniref:class I SAM-dependent methyltransferase n=1 Tax=Mucilaginibacter sp. NFR10 TaxID=1566292 RepID=UPI0008719A6A|nr:methyltransferase domain-containing protein [Mucilaginibacter sp. NFR10]SCW61459.1 Methyltransferase domain-containing protein [Mucilaginibacter sp. NFR10]